MGKLKPKYRPKIKPDDLSRCMEIVSKRTIEHAIAQRARLAILLVKEPHISNPEAGRQIGCHENTVRYWRKEWATKEFRLEDLPRSGRPPVFFPEADSADKSSRMRIAGAT